MKLKEHLVARKVVKDEINRMIEDFQSKDPTLRDKEELEHQIGIAINSRTKTFRLTENWFKTFSDLENNKIMEKTINGVMDKNKKAC